MEDILVIFTGGTIGSSVGDDGFISLDDEGAFGIVDMYADEYGGRERFKCIQPFTFLSENAVQDTWNRLLEVLRGIDLNDWKGIIITHGTDSVSYTAALLGVLYKDVLPCPLVLVTTNKPPAEKGSNALMNFAGAVRLIDYLALSGGYNDVYAVWHGGDFYNVYRGMETVAADTATDNISVYGGQPFAEFYPEGLSMTGNSYNWRVVINDKHEDRCGIVINNDRRDRIISGEIPVCGKVAFIQQYPGLDYNIIDTEKADAVLVYTYHSGTLCTAGEETSFTRFAGECAKRGKRLYVASLKKSDEMPDEQEITAGIAGGEGVKENGANKAPAYITTKEWMDAGVIPLYDMSKEAAYIYCVLSESLRIAGG